MKKATKRRLKVKKGRPPKKFQKKKSGVGPLSKFLNRLWPKDQEKHKGPKI